MRYIASFITGFEKLVAKELPRALRGVRIAHIEDGLVSFDTERPPQDVMNIRMFTNCFVCYKGFSRKESDFFNMARDVEHLRFRPVSGKKGDRFRLRFSDEGKMVPVQDKVKKAFERGIEKQTGMRGGDAGGGEEFWLMRRRGGSGYFLQLLKKPKPGKAPRAGELRPELAHLMWLAASLQKKQIALDPFAGYGALPVEAEKGFAARVTACDADAQKVAVLKQRLSQMARVHAQDARSLQAVESESVHAIATDPPWGIYRKAENLDALYREAVAEMARVLKPGGRCAILCGAPLDLPAFAKAAGLGTGPEYTTLVNGKKSKLYVFLKPKAKPAR